MKHDKLPIVGNGARYFHAGYFKPRPGQTYEGCTPIAERYMINAALEEGVELLNVSLTRMATHNIAFTGAAAGRGIFSKMAEVPAK